MRASASCRAAHRAKEPEGDELRPQRGRIREMDRVKAERACGSHVGLDVVYKNGAQRVDRKAFEQRVVDAWLRLDRADLARDQDAAEPAEEIKTLTCVREAL